MQQEGTNDDLPEIMTESPRAERYQGDPTLETDSSILNCTILNSGVNNDTGLEFDGENYNYLLALMQCEEPGMNALNWVVGTPAPIHRPISPAQTSSHHRQRITVFATPIQSSEQKSSPKCTGDASGRSFILDPAEIDPCCSTYRKPNCSYTCLIGMALQASKNGCLPVNEIYKFIEREYPFFRTAPEGWKNSVRHSLSLNQCFRKVERTDGWQGKKGYFWEINPERKGTVEREIDKWLKDEGRHLIENPNGLCAPLDVPFSNAFPVSLQARVPVMPPYLQSPCTPQRSSVTSALGGLAGQWQTPQQLAQLQHFAQQLQQECAERMALLQSPSVSSPNQSLTYPNNSHCSRSADGSTSSSGGAGASSRILFNVDEPPSHYVSSLERSNSNLEDLSSNLFDGFDVSNFDEAESSFHSFILSDDVTFHSDADQVIAMSPAAEVEVLAMSGEGDSPTIDRCDSTSHVNSDLCSDQGANVPSPDAAELSHSTPLLDQKDGTGHSEPCSSKATSTLKKDGIHRPCACKRLFGSRHQSSSNEKEGEEGEGRAMANLGARLKLKTSLRKHVTPKRLHPPYRQPSHLAKSCVSPRHGGTGDTIIGEMAATGEETEVAPSWGEPGFPTKISLPLNRFDMRSNLQPMHVDKPLHGGDASSCGYQAQPNNPTSLSYMFHDPTDLGQMYWNDSDITSPPLDALTEEELKELQKDLFNDDFSVVFDKTDSSTGKEEEEEGVLSQGHFDCEKKLSRDVLLKAYSPLMDPNASSLIDDTLNMSKGIECEHAMEDDVEGIKKITDELQRGAALCGLGEQPTISEKPHSI